ncbi:MAG TPA: SDR family NAD(P)-dependent oxidoreductase, partial [Acidimicrobiales bacterium]|nr:SDR family NAD(P)-dependent oxidoreductase [Acidimicrobiales bacterium]
ESAYDASKAALTAFSESMAVDLWDRGIRVLVVYPGLVDTELFALPDNDPVIDSGITPVPVGELVAAVFDALDGDAVQVYVPSWFADIVTSKAADVGAFLAGSAGFVASKRPPA